MTTDRGKVVQASVLPMPQVEVGWLSPNQSRGVDLQAGGVEASSRAPVSASQTPRLPLADLNLSTVSQRRLFATPVSAVGVSNTPVVGCLTSPSSLLYTQVPHSADHPNQERVLHTGVGRRNENLRVEKMKNTHSAYPTPDHEKQTILLLLAEKDLEMKSLRENLAEVEAENRHISIDLVSAKEELERRSKELDAKEAENQKTMSAISFLRSYVTQLPTVEEVGDLKRQLDTALSSDKDRKARLEDCLMELNRCKAALKSERETSLKLRVELEEAKRIRIERETRERESERLRYTARNMDQTQAEQLAKENAHLRARIDEERKKAVDRVTELEATRNNLEDVVKELNGLLESANIQIRDVSSKLRDSEARRGLSEAEVRKLATANSKIKRCKTELEIQVEQYKAHESKVNEVWNIFALMYRKLNTCIGELSTLNDQVRNLQAGQDLNISVLMKTSELPEPQAANSQFASLTAGERVRAAKEQLAALDRLMDEIEKMRDVLRDAYSERLCDNLNSCVTQ